MRVEADNISTEVQQNVNFWDSRWRNQETGWDIGSASPAITKFLSEFPNKEAAILIPGCGNAYEAEFLINKGFKNITVLDISPTAVRMLKQKFKQNKEISVLCENFFGHSGKYEVIIEQTFFCAIPPSMRLKYVQKSSELLKLNGRIIGVLFNRLFTKSGPPFGGNITEYESLFNQYFKIQKMEECYNSIDSRKGSEVFVNLKKE